MAEISGKFRYENIKKASFPAVGDFIMVDRINDKNGNAIIHSVLPRKSAFERTFPGNEHETQIIASNIDTIFICTSLNNNYNLNRIERYLSIAWDSGALPVIVLTKSDLCENLPEILSEVSDIAIGVDVIVTSNRDENSCNKLLSYIKAGTTASFIGSSGVGKSTLINLLLGEEILTVFQIRDDDKGRHTTTGRELFVLENGGIVIDTPGMRELALDSADISKTFSDIDELIPLCRFRDCTHTNEPGCAILESINDGKLDERRLESYLKLKRESKYDGLSSKQIEVEKFNSMFKGVGGMKNIRKFNRENDKRKR